MHRLVGILLATAALIAGCDGNPSTSARPPERPVLTAAPEPGVAYVAIVGDSYTSGSPEGGHGSKSWASLVVNQLRSQHFDIETNLGAVGASGYVAPGHEHAGVFDDQVGRVVGTNDNLVVIFGSRNDAMVPAEQLAPAVAKTLNDIKQRARLAKILIIGPVWPNNTPTLDIQRDRDILKAQAEAVGATFLDPLADQWFWDRPDLIGSDQVQPTDDGHIYMADRIAPVMAQLLPPPAP